MATSAVSSVQQVGQSALDTGLSIFDKIYNNPFIHGFLSLMLALLISGILIFLSKILALFVRSRISKSMMLKRGTNGSKMGILIGDVVFYSMSFVSIYIAFSLVGVDIKLLMSGVTIGVGFAFRQTLSNMISGIVIFSTEEYKIGNIVQLKSEGDVFGIIEEINMKHIIIRSFDMRRVIIPNSSFLRKVVKTYSSEEFLRLDVEVFLDINRDVDLVLSDVLNLVNTFNFVINKEYTQVLFEDFDDKKAKINVQFFFNPHMGISIEYMKSYTKLNVLNYYKSLDKQKKESLSKENK